MTQTVLGNCRATSFGSIVIAGGTVVASSLEALEFESIDSVTVRGGREDSYDSEFAGGTLRGSSCGLSFAKPAIARFSFARFSFARFSFTSVDWDSLRSALKFEVGS